MAQGQSYGGVPPGPLAAYLSVREANRGAGLSELQQVGAAQGLLARMQAQQMDQQFREAIGKLGPNPDPQQVASIAMGFGKPDLAVQFANQVENRKMREALVGQTDATKRELAAQSDATKRELAGQSDTLRRDLAERDVALRRELAAGREGPAPIVQTDDQGNTTLYDRQGNVIKHLGKTGKISPTILKERMARTKMNRDLSLTIPTLEEISRDGGLLDQATGSVAGALVDIASGFFGYGTPGAIAIGKLKPATDAVLKLVPRFEGPQSDKDTKMYLDAAGNLGNPNTPNSVKKAAAKTILKIYKQRQGQFVTKDYESETGGSSSQQGEWKDL